MYIVYRLFDATKLFVVVDLLIILIGWYDCIDVDFVVLFIEEMDFEEMLSVC
jgi:hypothetical protein